ncbi:hypothetical protein CEQ90_14930 [Lewinellaceae bacterium SD302]|nr:hypothetical protein CEQ90_14930 [Lewinellaceae bacterium SD302]
MAFKWWKIDKDEVAQPYYLLISDQHLGRIPVEKTDEKTIEASLNAGHEPAGLQKLPLNSINTVHIEEGKPELVIHFGEGSEEIYPIRSSNTIYGAFHYLKELHPSANYILEKPSPLRAGKNILITALILSVFFGWAYYVAIGLENDAEARPSFFLVDLLAGLGTQTLTLTYTLIAGLCFVLLLQKVGRPVVRHVLRFE